MSNAVAFADYLTRKGAYTFNVHDIRKYAEQYDAEEAETDE